MSVQLNRLIPFVSVAALSLATFSPQASGGRNRLQPTGSLTGTVTDEQKHPVFRTDGLLARGVSVDLDDQATPQARDPEAGRAVFERGEVPGRRVAADVQTGGLYSFPQIKPGVYNLVVEAGKVEDRHFRPQHILGVNIRPQKETTLDITLHEGDALEEVGEPLVNAPKRLSSGWLDGTVATPEGKPIFSRKGLIVAGVTVVIKKSTGQQVAALTDRLAGGFFSAGAGLFLLPGDYSVIVEAGKSSSPNDNTLYRPQLIRNVVIRPGVRTFLKITAQPGEALLRVDAPQLKTQKVKLATP